MEGGRERKEQRKRELQVAIQGTKWEKSVCFALLLFPSGMELSYIYLQTLQKMDGVLQDENSFTFSNNPIFLKKMSMDVSL